VGAGGSGHIGNKVKFMDSLHHPLHFLDSILQAPSSYCIFCFIVSFFFAPHCLILFNCIYYCFILHLQQAYCFREELIVHILFVCVVSLIFLLATMSFAGTLFYIHTYY